MSAAIDLYNDITQARLVRGFTSIEPFQFGPLFQYSQLLIRYFPMTWTGMVKAPFAKVPLAPLTLTMAIGTRAGVQALKAYQATWTMVSDDGGLTGHLEAVLDLNTSDMNTAIGSLDFLDSFFEIVLGESGVKRVVFQSAIRIYAAVIDPAGGAALPVAGGDFPTWAEIRGLCVMWAGNPAGRIIELKSPDGNSARLLGVGDSKEPIDYVV